MSQPLTLAELTARYVVGGKLTEDFWTLGNLTQEGRALAEAKLFPRMVNPTTFEFEANVRPVEHLWITHHRFGEPETIEQLLFLYDHTNPVYVSVEYVDGERYPTMLKTLTK